MVAAVGHRARPHAVTSAAFLQVLTAIPFVLGSVVVLNDGARAQAAAEAELVRQGLPPTLLAEQGVSFGSNTAELPLASAIVLVLVALAVLNLRGDRIGRVGSWIFHPVLFVAGAVIVPGQVLTARYMATAFGDDPVLARVDVPALVDAAAHVMPSWLIYANVGKLVLTTLGSAFVVCLLALPQARGYVGSGPAAQGATWRR